MTDPVAAALLSPAILPIVALGLLLAGRYRGAALTVLILVLFSLEVVPHLLIAPLLPPPSASTNTAPGAIVVLASGVPDLLDTSRTSPGMETLKRLRAAAALSRATGTRILVSGARAADDPTPVAAHMAFSLDQDFGVRASWAETVSTNLWQSAAASAAILRQAGVGDVYLVAQPWELKLSVKVFRAAGLAVIPVPIPDSGEHPLDGTAFVPVTAAWLDSALALRQWTGLACQWVDPCAAWMTRPTPDPS